MRLRELSPWEVAVLRGEPTPFPKCMGLTYRGRPCLARAVFGSRWCAKHGRAARRKQH